MVTRKSKSNDSEPEMKLTRASKIFEERFEKLRLAFRQAEGDEIDDVFAAIVSHLTSSEEECKQFMLRCNYTQMRTLLLVLDDVASAFATWDFCRRLNSCRRGFRNTISPEVWTSSPTRSPNWLMWSFRKRIVESVGKRS